MNIIYTVSVIGIWFLSMYFTITLLLILYRNRKNLYEERKHKGEFPFVSIIVPAFNEEASIVNSIKSLLKIDYPKDKYEIIVVNDGSSDNTSKEVKSVKNIDNLIFVDKKENHGKAYCLNVGIKKAKGEYIATMDADSEVLPDTLKKVIPFFNRKNVGAVTVTVELKHTRNWLEKIIDIEYTIGLSLALKALSIIDAVHVTPGPFSVYKKKLLLDIGMFDVKNITEDLEIAYRIRNAGYTIENCASARVRTITPNTIKSLYVQRRRWYTGTLETVKHHRKLFFKKRMGLFSVIVPYTIMLSLLGLGLFYFSTYLGLSNLTKGLYNFSLTSFNMLSYFRWEGIDFLKINMLTILGTVAVLCTIINVLLCMKIAGRSIRKNMFGVLGFVFFFFIYQVFWTTSVYSFITRKGVKWR